VLAKEQRDEGKFTTTKNTIISFTYQDSQFAMVFKDKGSTSLPDGELYHSGTVEFVSGGETVLGLNITLEHHEYMSDWRYSGIYSLKMEPWSKALLEIAAYIRAHGENSSNRHRDERVMDQAKNISI
jgi:hypothetical protein